MNTLLENSARIDFQTDLHEVFQALGGRQKEFNWLLTNVLVYGYQLGLATKVDPDAAYWISGADLTAMVETHHMQFVWGVLSGFDPETNIDLNQLLPRPFAEFNTALWQPNVHIQHPLAQMEIVCWDSGYTMLLSRDQDLTARFRAYFPEAVDLDEYNRRQHS